MAESNSSLPLPGAAEKKQEDKQEKKPDDLSMLKGYADLLGLKYPKDVSFQDLDKLVKEHLLARSKQAEQPSEVALEPEKPLSRQELRHQQTKEYLRLVRVRVTCLDPKKKDLHGEILTVANGVIGKVSKYVPYGDHCPEEGYFVPYILLLMMKERKFVQIKTDSRNNPTASEVSEYAFEELPPLKEEELKRLAMKQAAASGNAA